MTGRRAFTLIELLVAVALLVILTAVIVFLFQRSVRIFMTADAHRMLDVVAHELLQVLHRDRRLARQQRG